MRFLLDTHVFLWMQAEPDKLGPEARKTIEDPANSLLLSAASSWEIAIKYAIGRLSLPEVPATYVPSRMARSGVTGLAIEHVHALATQELEDHHNDPFDRLIVAQAITEGLVLITADHKLTPYPVDIRSALR